MVLCIFSSFPYVSASTFQAEFSWSQIVSLTSRYIGIPSQIQGCHCFIICFSVSLQRVLERKTQMLWKLRSAAGFLMIIGVLIVSTMGRSQWFLGKMFTVWGIFYYTKYFLECKQIVFVVILNRLKEYENILLFLVIIHKTKYTA